MHGLLIKTNGVIEYVKVNEPTYMGLGELVGGCFELVRYMPVKEQSDFIRKNNFVMVVNENGIFEGLTINNVASYIYGNIIVGDAVIVKEGYVDGEPDLVGITEDEAGRFLKDMMLHIMSYEEE